MASLYQKSNGYFQAEFTDSKRGKRRRFSLGTKDRSEARQILAEWEKKHRLGEIDVFTQDPRKIGQEEEEERLSLGEAFERFMQSRREKNATESTLQTYEWTVGRFVRDTGEETPLKALSACQIRAYVHAKGNTSATKFKRYRHVRAFIRFATGRLRLEESPLKDVTKPRVEEKVPVACTPEELTAISEALIADYRRLRRMNQIPPRYLVWRLSAFWFAFYTGLRRGEIAALKWGDVSDDCRTLTLRTQKNRRVGERLPISEKAAKILRNLPRGKKREYVFNAPGTSKTERSEKTWGESLSRCFAKYKDEAGAREELDFHSLRKSFGSQLAKSGASAHVIKRAMRHKTLETALAYVALHNDDIRGHLDAAF